jgi:tetratricopeptide (TPR) repeat protein
MTAPHHAIFISYRRRETVFAVDQLDQALRTAFGSDAVFRDVRSIRKGQDFPTDVRAALGETRVGIVFIGPWWLNSGPDGGDRLVDPDDWVRLEIESLLQRQHDGSPIPVIPIYTGGAQPPQAKDLPDSIKSLATRHGMKFDPFPDTEHSIQLVVKEIARILGVTPWPFASAASQVQDEPTRLSPSRLSVTGKKFVGREQELHLLDEAWGRTADDKINVVSFIGQGGEGKTAVVLEWSSRRARGGWPGVRRVFEWSFYSQGTSAQSSASADEFFNKAFEWFGHTGEIPKDPRDKGAKLAELVATERTLLLLDGLEPLQQPPQSGYGGEFKDPAMKALVRGLARRNSGLCILTSRVDIADLADFERADGTCVRHSLHALDLVTARSLLREYGVRGPEKELDEAITWFHSHAYDLNLLGNYFAQCTADHDIRGWPERFPILSEDERIHPVPDATGKRAGHGRRMLRAYVRWLGEKSAAVAVLRMLGLFDRPARSDLLDELREEPVIPGLTDPLVGLQDSEWLRTLDQLKQLGLVTREPLSLPPDAGTPKAERPPRPTSFAVDAHPLLREHFKSELQDQIADSWQAAHRRLYEYLCETTADKPEPTLEDLQPLYQAVAHGCKTGLQQEACYEVYVARILRGKKFYSKKKLGAFASDLGAVASFFETPWRNVSQVFSKSDEAWLLNDVAMGLRALGRLAESAEPLRYGMHHYVELESWRNAAMLSNNLSELELVLGDLAEAVKDAEQSVSYADRSGHIDVRVMMRTTHADALHQTGRRSQAKAHFIEAEQMQKEDQLQFPLLYSLQGYQYCDLLMSFPERAAWQRTLECERRQSNKKSRHSKMLHLISKRGEQMLHWAQTVDSSLIGIAVAILAVGRAALYKAVLSELGFPPDSEESELKGTLNEAVNGLRRFSHQEYLVPGLLTRAWLQFLSGASTGSERAQEDLDEAWEIAERGPMRLHMADIHLYRARLFFREKEYPWESAQADLEAAEKLINECGYHRRDEELADAKRVILRQSA